MYVLHSSHAPQNVLRAVYIGKSVLSVKKCVRDSSDPAQRVSGEFHLLGLSQLPRLPRLVSFFSFSSLHVLKFKRFLCFVLTAVIVRLCLVGAADTPGCVSLLPASLFSNSNPG